MCMMAPATATRKPATAPAPGLKIQEIDAWIIHWTRKARDPRARVVGYHVGYQHGKEDVELGVYGKREEFTND